jgi:hypothetical protein
VAKPQRLPPELLTPTQPSLPDFVAAEAPRASEPPRAPDLPRAPEPSLTSEAPEPRFPATASEPPPGPLDWLRAKSKPVTTPIPPALVPPAMHEPPMVELTDEAPLSPRSPQRPAMPPAIEAALEPKAWTAEPPRSMPPRAEQPMPRATPQVEPPKERERFDLVWPDRGGGAAPPAPAPAEPKLEMKREPAPEMPLPPIPARPREMKPANEKRMPEILRKPAAERGPTILKSGVIDGMPYTLYADGSIEAQLPQGMVKFASVDALRAHLEKQS